MDYEKELKEYLDEYLFPPQKNWPKEAIRKRSIERSTVFIILEEIKKNPSMNIKHILSVFHDKMDKIYEETSDKETSIIYSIARDVTKDLYLLFC